ncbi:MAG: DUF2207 domain-containing protein, partial [Vicinamibacteraceae bacterium]|nr:DUF2207 domain-containing protein [Vicinamibacteraceae bacterium]
GIDEISLVPLADAGLATPVRTDGEISVRRREGRLRVTWSFPATRDGARAYRLAYRVRGAVTHGDGGPALWWTPLPRDHDYVIDRSRIEIHWPPGLRLAALPSIERRRMAPPVPDVEDTSVAFTLAGLGRDAWFEILLPFAPGETAMPMPAWQQRDRRQAEYAPRLAGAAALVALLGIALFGLLYLQSPRGHAEPATASGSTHPPDALPVAVAGALQSGTTGPSLPHAMATLFDLAERGHLRIEEGEAGRFGGRSFTLVRGEGRDPLAHAFERALIDAIFTGPRGPEPRVTSTDAQRRLLKHWSPFRKAVSAWLADARLTDPDRIAARRRLFLMAWLAVALAIAALVGSFFFLDRFGPAVLLPAAALGIAAASGFVFGAMLSPLSDAGLRAKARWEAFGRTVKDVARGKRPLAGPGEAERLLVWAVAVGAGAAFVRMAAQGHAVLPAWFAPLAASSDERHAAFAAFLSTHASASSGHGAGGGGAGGGGSSGAS